MRAIQHRLISLSFDQFATFAFFIVVGTAACLMPAQNDTWWQLRAGHDIVAFGGVPLRDAFSFTRAGEYWPNHEWLAQVIFYTLFRVGGLPLLTLAAAAVVTSAWLIVWRLTPGTTWQRLGLSTLALPVVVGQWSLRPQVFTLLFLAVTLLFLVKRREAWLPLLFVVWANAHGGVVLGVAVVLGVTAARLLRGGGPAVRPIGLAAACILATAVTPLGFSLWTEVPASLGRLRQYGVTEWQAASLTDVTLLPYWLLLGSLVGLVLARRPWQQPEDTPLLLACAALALLPVSLSATRNAPPFLLLAIPAVGGLLRRADAAGTPPARRDRPLLHAVTLAATALAGVTVVAFAWGSQAGRLQWHPLSDGAIAAVERCEAPLYNRYDDGGYLIWFVPSRKVFLDSRQDPYPPELVSEHIRVETTGDYRATFDRYGIGCAFVPVNSLLARRLADSPWERTYADERWAVFRSE